MESTAQTPSLYIDFCLAELVILPSCPPAAKCTCLSLISPGDAVKYPFHPGAPVSGGYNRGVPSSAAPNSTQRVEKDSFPSCHTNIKPQRAKKTPERQSSLADCRANSRACEDDLSQPQPQLAENKSNQLPLLKFPARTCQELCVHSSCFSGSSLLF